jgi:sarcosine oxidase subunit alpha
VSEHPKGQVTVFVDGQATEVAPGTSAAVAVLASGRAATRRSVTGEPRGPVCGMGVCFECRATIDGVPHRRACLVTCAPGMEIRTDA